MDAQQEVFMAIRKIAKDLGYPVYDTVLPREEVPYPFVYIGESEQVDQISKGGIYGSVILTVHVYGLAKKRGEVSEILLKIKEGAYALNRVKSFAGAVVAAPTRLIPDGTTKDPLLHGVVEITFSFN